MYAHVAQLGERQTEDLKVLGSIPSVGKCSPGCVLPARFGGTLQILHNSALGRHAWDKRRAGGRRQPDLNRRGHSPPDFESGALTTRP